MYCTSKNYFRSLHSYTFSFNPVNTAGFMVHLLLLLHTPEKKARNINYATQHHHLVAEFLTRDKAMQKGIDFRDLIALVVHLRNNNLKCNSSH